MNNKFYIEWYPVCCAPRNTEVLVFVRCGTLLYTTTAWLSDDLEWMGIERSHGVQNWAKLPDVLKTK